MIGSSALFIAVLLAEAASPAPLAPKERVICRTYEVTGSLAGTKKVCRTAKEWDDASRAARESGERLQDQGRVAPRDPRGG